MYRTFPRAPRCTVCVCVSAAGGRLLRTEPLRERSRVLQPEQRLLLQLQLQIRRKELLAIAKRLREQGLPRYDLVSANQCELPIYCSSICTPLRIPCRCLLPRGQA